VLGDFSGGGDGRVFLCGDLVNMNIDFKEGNSRDIFHNYRGVYCDECVEEIANSHEETK
tara:strand:+ start:231 stop:407 length:177 start_codon:yes stop_codon:yes gene_type:complete